MNDPFPDTDDAALRAAPVLRQIGTHLRMAREERGEELGEVAAFLRIRRNYLESLEAGELGNIPGRAYALGFLRSYGDHLGFNGEAIVDEVKRTDQWLPESPQLHVREPLTAGQRPPLLLVGVSLALAAAVYVGWTYWQDQLMPPRLIAAPPSGTMAADGAPPAEPTAAPAVPSADMGNVEAPRAADVDLPPLPAVPDPPLPDANDLDDEAAVAEITAADDAVVASILDGQGTLGAGDDEATPEVSSAAESNRDEDGASAAAMSEILATVAAESGGAARAFGDAGGRVVLFASEASWVQIRSASRDFVWTQTMEAGDAYFVPDRDDLALWTGNAGGLRVMVDGQPLAELGARGQVRRDIPLAADELTAQYRGD